MRNPPENYLEVLQESFATLPLVLNVLNQEVSDINEVLITTNQQGRITAFQRWFNFKEAFSPSFVMGAIESLGYQPKHILDPFGGSGTTAITAQLLDINVTTIEINPFIADLIAAKATPIQAKVLREASVEFSIRLLSAPIDHSRLSHLPPTFIEDDSKERWIFPKAVAARITQYLFVIDSFSNKDLQRLLKVILGSVLISSSNVYVDGKGRRYRDNWKYNQPTVKKMDDSFNEQFQIVFEDCLRFEDRPTCAVNIHKGDSRSTIVELNEPVDLIVFSPPYPNTFDYTDIYNVELWILGYLTNSQDNRKLRKSTLRSHVQAQWNFDWPITHSELLNDIYNSLVLQRTELWNKNIPEMVVAYFKDLEGIIINCYRLLEPNGKVIMVVGDSKYLNILINVADVLYDLAIGAGFKNVVKKEVRKMRTSSQQGGGRHLSEWIIELSNSLT